MKILLIFATFLLLFATYFHPISAITQDLGRHIKTGEIIVNTFNVPKTNLYSYTFPDFSFINHHWGSEVVFYALSTNFGITSTLFVTILCSILAFGLVYFFAYKKSDPIALAIVSFLSLGILFERTDVRPEAFSFLFTALFLVILFKNREKPTKWLAALIPLQLLWVNTHVYFIIGTLTIGLFLLDAIISFLYSKSRSIKSEIRSTKSETISKFKFSKSKTFLSFLFRSFEFVSSFDIRYSNLCIVLLACCLVTLFNPNGLSGALFPFRVFENYGYSIEENQNIFFLWDYSQKRTIAFFWVSVVLLFSTLSIRAKHTRSIDWLLAITFTILGAQAIRNFPLYVFAVFIPFTYHINNVIPNLFRDPKNNAKEMLNQVQHDKIKLGATIILLLLFLWQLSYVLSTKPIGFSTPAGASKAVDFMQTRKLKGPIFNNFDIGSYLIFQLYPNEKVFVDGRPEAYPASFFQETYIPMQQDPQLFAKMDKKYGFNTIFFAHTDQTPWAKQFLSDIIKNSQWQIVYLDETVIILTKTIPKSPTAQTFFEKFQPTPKTDIQSLYQLVLFFQAIENPEKQIEVLQQILQKNPSDCTALGLLLQSTDQNNPMIPVYQGRYQHTCQ